MEGKGLGYEDGEWRSMQRACRNLRFMSLFFFCLSLSLPLFLLLYILSWESGDKQN